MTPRRRFRRPRPSAEATLEAIGDAVMTTDLEGRVTYLNTAAEAMTGWSRASARGHKLSDVFRIIDRDTRAVAPDPMQLAVKLDRTVGLAPNCLLVRRDGHEAAIEDSAAPIRDAAGHVIGAVIVFRDVGATLARSRQMDWLAQHDALTGLPNRLLLGDRLTEAIALAKRRRKPLGVLFIDVDGFKAVNDTFGHAAGDRVLCSIGARLTQGLRHSDTVSRYGGDEFVVVLTEIDRSGDAARVAGKLAHRLREPSLVGTVTPDITASIGLSLYPDHGVEAATLIAKADAAMYEAKRAGSGLLRIVAPTSGAPAVGAIASQECA